MLFCEPFSEGYCAESDEVEHAGCATAARVVVASTSACPVYGDVGGGADGLAVRIGDDAVVGSGVGSCGVGFCVDASCGDWVVVFKPLITEVGARGSYAEAECSAFVDGRGALRVGRDDRRVFDGWRVLAAAFRCHGDGDWGALSRSIGVCDNEVVDAVVGGGGIGDAVVFDG